MVWVLRSAVNPCRWNIGIGFSNAGQRSAIDGYLAPGGSDGLIKTGYFGYAGGGKNGALVDAWLSSRFLSIPAQGANPPVGIADAGPVTTDVSTGGPGSFALAMPYVADYWIRFRFNGDSYWTECPAGSIGGQGATGFGTVLFDYANTLIPATSDFYAPVATVTFTQAVIGMAQLGSTNTVIDLLVNGASNQSITVQSSSSLTTVPLNPQIILNGGMDYLQIQIQVAGTNAGGLSVMFG